MTQEQFIEAVKDLFYKFLVEEGALFNFCSYKTIDQAIEEIEATPNHVIAQLPWKKQFGFLIWCIPNTLKSFDLTNEGFDFWQVLDIKWKEIYTIWRADINLED